MPKTTYPWDDPATAMQFAFQLSNARISEELQNSELSGTLRERGAERRLTVLLNMLEDFAPIAFATLWKHKRRSGHLSAIARSRSYQPDPSRLPNEFVCQIENTHAATILEKKCEFPECSISWIQFWECKNIGKLPEDEHWNTKSLIKHGCHGQPLERQFAVTLGNFCHGEFDGELEPQEGNDTSCTTDFILNFYLDMSKVGDIEEATKKPFTFAEGPARDFIKSIANKVASGICALIELRKNQITKKMLAEHSADQQSTMKSALTSATANVLPEFIKCEHVFLVSSSSSGHLVQFFDSEGTNEQRYSMQHTDLIDLRGILQFISKTYPSKGNSSYLVKNDEIRQNTSGRSWISSANQLLIGRISPDSSPSSETTYLVLVNRKSDLANISSNKDIDDYFDWEDQEYLEHIISILNYIYELFAAREHSIQRAGVLGHEIKAPIAFIYETAYRQKEVLEGQRKMFHRMQVREVEDILDTAEYIETLGTSLSALLKPENLPPSLRYEPDEIALSEVARDMARICLPLCKKYRLDHSSIIVPRSFHKVFMDESSLRQIFLNLLVNSVKYANVNVPKDFRVSVSIEDVTVDGLLTTSNIDKNAEFASQLRASDASRGILVTVSDRGIGIAGTEPQLIFEPGFREVANIRAGVFGAGVGLSVVRSILRDHGADIWVESARAPTSISFFLPEHLESDEYTRSASWTSA